MTASSAASPMQPDHPRTAPLSTAIVIAPEDVEHPVGRRREAHVGARGGAGAGDEGAGGLEAEEQQEGDERPAADCVCMCVSRSNTNRERANTYVHI